MISLSERDLAAYLNRRDVGINSRLLGDRVFRGTIRTINYPATGVLSIQINRNGDISPDLTSYFCSIPNYEPAIGDTVDLIYRSKDEAVVLAVVNSLHSGLPTISGVAGTLSGTPTVVGNDYGGIITFVTGGANVAAVTNLFTVNFATPFQAIPASLVGFMNALGYTGAGMGTDQVTAAKFAVVNGDILGATNTFKIAYIVRGTKQI